MMSTFPILRMGSCLFGLTLLIASSAGCRRGDSQVVPDAHASSPEPASSSAVARDHNAVSLNPELLRANRIQLKPATRQALADEVSVAGQIVPSVDGEAQVGPSVGGRISSILVKEGDRVKAGQLLAWIDAPDAARMQGDLLRAKTTLNRAEKVLEQERSLWADKATSERALNTADSEVRAARAELQALNNLLAASKVPVPTGEAGQSGTARIAVAAPLAGVITKRNAVVGAQVTRDLFLFHIVAPDKLLVRADVPEVVSRRVELGASAVVHPRGVAQGCNGEVRARLEQIDEAKRTMGVMVRTSPDCVGLVAGAFADVRIRLTSSGEKESVVVPRSAIVDLDGSPVVFVERNPAGAGHFEVRSVRLGNTDGVSTVIEDGVKEGDRLVVVGALLLKGERKRAELGAE